LVSAAEPDFIGDSDVREEEPADGGSQATRLIGLVGRTGCELFHDSDGHGYATFRVRDHRETHLLTSTTFKRWLARLFFEAEGTVPNQSTVRGALDVLEGIAQFEGEEHAVYVRVAGYDGTVYVDLGDEQWRVIEIDAEGWQIVSDSPVRFRRPRGLRPLPVPVPGGHVDALRPFLNLADDRDWYLVVGWMLGAFSPRGPYGVLGLYGEQGTAKTTTARVAREVVDPNAAAERSEPRDTRDLMIAATNAWVVSLDNLSHLTPELSDGLCRLSTGGAFATRALYTDTDEVLLEAQRPVILTGIEGLATRGDLLDRSLVITLPTISEESRRDERTFWAEFEQVRPLILGAFLDALAFALGRLDTIDLPRLPRLADFAKLVTAAEPALGWPDGSFVAAYALNRQEANEITLDATAIGQPIIQLVSHGPFEGTATELLRRLTVLADGNIARSRDWPKAPNKLSGQLHRLSPALRAAGVEVTLNVKTPGSGSRRLIRLTPIGTRTDAIDATDAACPATTSYAAGAMKTGHAVGVDSVGCVDTSKTAARTTRIKPGSEQLVLAEIDELIAEGVLIPAGGDMRWAPTAQPAPEQQAIMEEFPFVDFGRLVPNEALCAYPEHRSSDWRTNDGRWMCGVCHPPVPGAASA
jgi:hypothetical protein